MSDLRENDQPAGAQHPASPDLTVPKESKASTGCQIRMLGGRRCGRQRYEGPHAEFGDSEDVCLMHSHDPAKSYEKFKAEFVAILEAAGEGKADFSKFVFTSANCSQVRFIAICSFIGATFTQDANFIGAAFTQDAYFDGATVTQDAYVSYAKCTGEAYFHKVTFKQEADFLRATFTQRALFTFATFTQKAGFFKA